MDYTPRSRVKENDIQQSRMREGTQGYLQGVRSENTTFEKWVKDQIRAYTIDSHKKMVRKKLRALAHAHRQGQECTKQLCSGHRASTAERLPEVISLPKVMSYVLLCLPEHVCGLVSPTSCHWLSPYTLPRPLCPSM